MPIIYDNLPDPELFHRVQIKKEKPALLALFNRYAALVKGVALNFLSEPKAMQVVDRLFLSIWNSNVMTKSDNYPLWIYKETLAGCNGLIKDSVPNVITEAANRIPSPHPINTIPALQLQQALALSVHQLSAEEQEVVEDFYINGKNIRSIAFSKQKSDEAVLDELYTAREKISEQLNKANLKNGINGL